MSYTIAFKHTIGQDVWIPLFGIKGKILEISINFSRIIYEVRYFLGTSIYISYLYEDELEDYKGQDNLTGSNK